MSANTVTAMAISPERYWRRMVKTTGAARVGSDAALTRLATAFSTLLFNILPRGKAQATLIQMSSILLYSAELRFCALEIK